MKTRHAFLVVAIFLILTLAILSLFRYSIYPVHNSWITAYKLDRLTGNITILFGTKQIPLEQNKDWSFLPDKPKPDIFDQIQPK